MPKGVQLITYELTPLQAALEQLCLAVKSRFEFLNSLAHSLKQELMFLVGQGHEVSRAIITLDSVEMMDYPTVRKRFTVSLLPYQNMLSNIAFRVSSCMVGLEYKSIAGAFLNVTSALPDRMLIPGIRLKFSLLPKYLHTFSSGRTPFALSCPGAHRLAAIWAEGLLLALLVLKLVITLMRAADMIASLGEKRLVADDAEFLPFHTLIIHVKVKRCQ